MRNYKKFMAVSLVTLGAVVALAGCGSGSTGSTSSTNTEAEAGSEDSGIKTGTTDQLAMPQAGDIVATMHIKDYGDIVIRLFPEEAPKAVENFVTHAKEGYYDNVTFHRVIDDFMIQGGDPTGTGRGGESIWGTAFEDEFATNLMPIRGAFCMANAGADTNGSQFFIVQASEANLATASVELTEEQKKMFEENGGTPHLVYGYTVFGQVIEGMDVVDEISAVQTDLNDKPVEDVIIDSIDIAEAQ